MTKPMEPGWKQVCDALHDGLPWRGRGCNSDPCSSCRRVGQIVDKLQARIDTMEAPTK